MVLALSTILLWVSPHLVLQERPPVAFPDRVDPGILPARFEADVVEFSIGLVVVWLE